MSEMEGGEGKMEGDDGKRRGNGQGASAKTPMRRMRASGDRIGTAQQTPGGENTCGNGEAPGDLRWDIILIRQDADLAPAASRRPASRRLLSRSLLSTLHIIPATHGPPSLTARSSRCPSPNGAPPSAMFLQPPVAALHTAPSASFMNKDDQPSHLYLHQQRTVEVIQLIEVPPPPPRSHPYTSTIASSSFASSSCYSSDDDSEEDESVCSSYCSSEEDLAADQAPTYDDTYKTRLNRVLAWREGFTKATAPKDADDESTLALTGSFTLHVAPPAPSLNDVPPAPPSTPVTLSPAPSLKRKADDESRWDSDDETVSLSP